MSDFAGRLIALFERIHPLDRVARAGYVLRGVAEPESVAAHSHFVSLMTLLALDHCPGMFDRDKALTMALVHDLAEAELMDIPMPAGDAYLKTVKTAAEQRITEKLFSEFPSRYAEWHQELVDGETLEARLIRGLDKAQMMVKVLMYEREKRGRLDEFWENPRNFHAFGIRIVDELFDAICREAGRPRPG
jgi:putative hydrolase of HD superfamily